MSCGYEEDVSALFDGELNEADASRVRGHIETCATCRDLMADFEAVRESVRALHQVDAKPRSLWHRRVRVPLPVAAAIAVLLLGAPFVAFRRGEQVRKTEAPITRPSESGLLAPYDGGGRAVIVVRRREAR